MSKYNNAHELNNAFKDLSIEERSKIYNEIKAELPDLIHSALAVKKVFEYLLPEERAEVFEVICSRIPNFVKVDSQWNEVSSVITPVMKERLRGLIIDDLKSGLDNVLKHALQASVWKDRETSVSGSTRRIKDEAVMKLHSEVIEAVNVPAGYETFQLAEIRHALLRSHSAMTSREYIAMKELIAEWETTSGIFGKESMARKLENALGKISPWHRANVISSDTLNDVQKILKRAGKLDELQKSYKTPMPSDGAAAYDETLLLSDDTDELGSSIVRPKK